MRPLSLHSAITLITFSLGQQARDIGRSAGVR